jgi:hypothetical protein
MKYLNVFFLLRQKYFPDPFNDSFKDGWGYSLSIIIIYNQMHYPTQNDVVINVYAFTVTSYLLWLIILACNFACPKPVLMQILQICPTSFGWGYSLRIIIICNQMHYPTQNSISCITFWTPKHSLYPCWKGSRKYFCFNKKKTFKHFICYSYHWFPTMHV